MHTLTDLIVLIFFIDHIERDSLTCSAGLPAVRPTQQFMHTLTDLIVLIFFVDRIERDDNVAKLGPELLKPAARIGLLTHKA